jgi:hypothetical protein
MTTPKYRVYNIELFSFVFILENQLIYTLFTQIMPGKSEAAQHTILRLRRIPTYYENKSEKKLSNMAEYHKTISINC